ncbi:hypothetical protein [Luteolibacter soli]|uniref:HEAT repeat domain-containing protein n=1 Tax=Luteolibacter soli TaxID=3135280 RepID=A0ABU9AR26_9BACT
MNTPTLGPVLGLCVLISAICHGELGPQEPPSKDDTTPPAASQAKTPQSDAPYSDKFGALKETMSLDKIRTTEIEKLNEERRSIVASIAKEKGVKESEILAEFYKKWPDTNSILGRAYLKNPEIAVGSFILGLEGTARSIALISYASSLSRKDELGGLRKMYELVPPGKDRAQISSKLILTTCRLQGLELALRVLVELDHPDEKKAALMGLRANLSTAIKSPSEDDLKRIHQVAKDMGYERLVPVTILPPNDEADKGIPPSGPADAPVKDH